jgi:hypothetical protein
MSVLVGEGTGVGVLSTAAIASVGRGVNVGAMMGTTVGVGVACVGVGIGVGNTAAVRCCPSSRAILTPPITKTRENSATKKPGSTWRS